MLKGHSFTPESCQTQPLQTEKSWQTALGTRHSPRPQPAAGLRCCGKPHTLKEEIRSLLRARALRLGLGAQALTEPRCDLGDAQRRADPSRVILMTPILLGALSGHPDLSQSLGRQAGSRAHLPASPAVSSFFTVSPPESRAPSSSCQPAAGCSSEVSCSRDKRRASAGLSPGFQLQGCECPCSASGADSRGEEGVRGTLAGPAAPETIPALQ